MVSVIRSISWMLPYLCAHGFFNTNWLRVQVQFCVSAEDALDYDLEDSRDEIDDEIDLEYFETKCKNNSITEQQMYQYASAFLDRIPRGKYVEEKFNTEMSLFLYGLELSGEFCFEFIAVVSSLVDADTQKAMINFMDNCSCEEDTLNTKILRLIYRLYERNKEAFHLPYNKGTVWFYHFLKESLSLYAECDLSSFLKGDLTNEDIDIINRKYKSFMPKTESGSIFDEIKRALSTIAHLELNITEVLSVTGQATKDNP